MNSKEVTNFIKEIYKKEFIPLHEPVFIGNEKKYLTECIDSTFVSSVGKFVDEFENKIKEYVNSKYAIAMINGTSALHLALKVVGVKRGDYVITQPLTFVATTNAISYNGAKPIFLDVSKNRLSLSFKALKNFLEKNCIVKNKKCFYKKDNKTIRACVVMHTFGHPALIDKIVDLCKKWYIRVVEDSAESLGSFYKNRHTGTFGDIGIFSFNGNKIITGGNGGIAATNNLKFAKELKHLSTTAKLPHKYEYIHDRVGYNYRLSNINASLLLAQFEKLSFFLKTKRDLALIYKKFFKDSFISEPKNSKSNYWLNSIIFNNKKERDEFLKYSNSNGVMSRAVWRLNNKLDMFKNSISDDLKNATYLEERLVNIPSGVVVNV